MAQIRRPALEWPELEERDSTAGDAAASITSGLIMRLPTTLFALASTAALAAAPLDAQVQELDARLEFLAPLINRTWIGHFVGSADSTLTHRVRWDAILDGQAVRRTKFVPEVGFADDGYYFWDWETGQVAFLSVGNRGQVTRGFVVSEEGRVVLRGTWRDAHGVHDFALTLEIMPDGRLEDRYYNIANGERTAGHLIVYSAKGP